MFYPLGIQLASAGRGVARVWHLHGIFKWFYKLKMSLMTFYIHTYICIYMCVCVCECVLCVCV